MKSGNVAQLLDPSLGIAYDHDQIERMILAANLCIRHAPGLRPNISVVSLVLFSFIFNFELYLIFWFLIYLQIYLIVGDLHFLPGFEASARR